MQWARHAEKVLKKKTGNNSDTKPSVFYCDNTTQRYFSMPRHVQLLEEDVGGKEAVDLMAQDHRSVRNK